MALGPHIPEWEELQRCLTALASDAAASSASVFDAWGLPWCCAPKHDIFVARDIAHVLRRAFKALDIPLEHGGSFDRAFPADNSGAAYVKSFASIYIVVLRYDGLFDLRRSKRLVSTALPKIEALITALPPPHGPGSGSAEALSKA